MSKDRIKGHRLHCTTCGSDDCEIIGKLARSVKCKKCGNVFDGAAESIESETYGLDRK